MNKKYNDLVIEVDESLTVIRSEGSVMRILGCAPERVNGMDILELVSGEDTLIVSETLFALACDGGKTHLDVDLMTANGSRVLVCAELRAFRNSRGQHLFTRMGCSISLKSRKRDLSQADMFRPELGSVIGSIQEDITRPTEEAMTFSHFSLSDAKGRTTGEDIEKSTATMEQVIAVHSEGKGTAYRTGVNSVSVLHNDDFKPDVVVERIDRVVEDGLSSSSFSVDLRGDDVSEEDKIEAVSDFLGTSSLTPVEPEVEDDEPLSMERFKALIVQLTELAFESDDYVEEIFCRAADQHRQFVRLTFPEQIPWPRHPTDSQRSFARDRLLLRLDRVRAMTKDANAATPIMSVQAGMLPLVDLSEHTDTLKAIILQVDDFPAADHPDFTMVCERVKAIPSIMLNGIELTTNSAIQQAFKQADGLELVVLPYSVFRAAPLSTIQAFQQVLSAQTGHKIGVLIEDPHAEAAPELFHASSDVFLPEASTVELELQALAS